MSIEHLRHHTNASLQLRAVEHTGHVRPLRQDNALSQARDTPHRDEEFFAALSPLLDEADRLKEESPRVEPNGYLRLLEENAKLRKLAVRLSNLLGDLPASAPRKIEPGQPGGHR